MEAFTMKQAADIVGGTVRKMTKKPITDVVIDDRKVKPGSLFVAVRGERFDGHDFIRSAVDNGAVAAVSERSVVGVPVIQVENTRRALLSLAQFNRHRFSGMVVGVTGSVGKTTTKEMIAKVLSFDRKVLKTEGNLNNAIGLPCTLFQLDANYQAAVIEMGMSDLGEISALSQTACPTVGVITNIGVSHIENLGSRANIKRAKLEILDGMAMGTPLIVNGDDDLLCDLIVSENNLIFCGIDNQQADYRALHVKMKDGHTLFDIAYKNDIIPAQLPALGRHNVANALIAFAVGRLAGISADHIVKALKQYRPEGMRQKIVEYNNITVIEDCYNASPESMQAALLTFSQMEVSGRRIAVLGDMLELGRLSASAHYKIGETAAKLGVDVVYCIGRFAGDILEGAGKNGCIARHFENRDTLAEGLKELLQPGDSVLFKASRAIQLETVIEKVFS